MRRKLILFVLILILGIALRLYTFSQISSLDKFTWVGGDEPTYYELARNIQQGRGPVIDFVFQFWHRQEFGHNDGLWEPIFPLVLAFFFYSLGSSLLAAKIVVFLISIATLVLIFFIGKKLYSEKVGFIAMFLLAIQPKHIEYSATLLKDNLYVLLFLLAFFFMILAIKENKKSVWIWFGAILALAFLTRYFSIILVITAVIMLVLERKKVNWKNAGLALVAFLLVLAPWALYTYNEFGSPFFSITKYYPFAKEGWEGMSYESEPPNLHEYMQENSALEIIKTRLSLIPLTLYHLPIWMTPLVFLLFILVFSLKDECSKYLKIYFLIFTLLYMVQFASASQFIERAYFALMYASLVPIAFVLARISESGSKWKVKLDGKRILLIALAIILVTSILLLQWKINEIKGYDMQERQEAFQKLGFWINKNVPKDAVIMTIYPAEAHYYTRRKAVMDPYGFALLIDGVNPGNYKNRAKDEGEYYGADYFLSDLNLSEAKEDYPAFSLSLAYTDEGSSLYLYKIRKIV